MATVVLATLFAARPAFAIVFLTQAAQTAGLGAGQSFLDPEAELIVSLSDGSEVGCSGSLLAGGDYVLTAAHCVTGDTDSLTASNISIDFANVDLDVSSDSYIVDPTWDGNVENGGDLALIQLSMPITSITGYTVDTTSSAVGDTVTIAGYGISTYGTSGYGSTNNFGTLYDGTTRFMGVYSDVNSVYEYEFVDSGYWYTGSQEAMIAPGDSGGAALLDVDNTWEIVGVNDFEACFTDGCSPDASLDQYGGDTSVYADASFLDPYLAPEPGTLMVMGTGLFGLVAARRRSSPRGGSGGGAFTARTASPRVKPTGAPAGSGAVCPR